LREAIRFFLGVNPVGVPRLEVVIGVRGVSVRRAVKEGACLSPVSRGGSDDAATE
jgi:hypothetical protein